MAKEGVNHPLALEGVSISALEGVARVRLAVEEGRNHFHQQDLVVVVPLLSVVENLVSLATGHRWE